MALGKDSLKVKIDLSALQKIADKLETIPGKVPRDKLLEVGQKSVQKIKDFVSKGVSPIEGQGRFPGYKHAGVAGKYPANQKNKYPDKKQRPVNLFLSGDMLNALEVKTRSSTEIEIGYPEGDQAKKEQGHRDGANGQPKRPTIPEEGEQFNESIRNQMTNDYAALIDNIAEVELNKKEG